MLFDLKCRYKLGKMYAAARALKTHGKADLVSEKPLTLTELAFRRRRKKNKSDIPTHATTLFLKSYYSRNKEASFIQNVNPSFGKMYKNNFPFFRLSGQHAGLCF